MADETKVTQARRLELGQGPSGQFLAFGVDHYPLGRLGVELHDHLPPAQGHPDIYTLSWYSPILPELSTFRSTAYSPR